MKESQLFPSKWFKSTDVSGGGEIYTIKSVSMEKVMNIDDGNEVPKPVIRFEEAQKGFVVNKTNWERLAKVLGDEESDNWIGKKVKLALEEVTAFGKPTDAIRVQAA